MLLSACSAAQRNTVLEPIPAWRTDEGRVGVWRDLAAWYIDNNMPMQAMEMVTRLRENGSDTPELLLIQGRALLEQGMTEEARHILRDAASQMPKDPRPLQSLGIVQADLGEIELAIETFKRALEREDHTATRNNLAFLLLTQGECEDATDHFEQVLSSDATSVRYRNNLAFSLVCVDEPQRALKLFRSTTDEAGARYNMGVAYERLAKYPSAQLQYRQALTTNPDHDASLEAIARLELTAQPTASQDQEVE
jgi:Flp pilus assembly protein TadD